MAAKQLMGLFAPDGSYYVSFTSGDNMMTQTGITKQLAGVYAPDGSYYVCKTDGNGNLR